MGDRRSRENKRCIKMSVGFLVAGRACIICSCNASGRCLYYMQLLRKGIAARLYFRLCAVRSVLLVERVLTWHMNVLDWIASSEEPRIHHSPIPFSSFKLLTSTILGPKWLKNSNTNNDEVPGKAESINNDDGKRDSTNDEKSIGCCASQ